MKTLGPPLSNPHEMNPGYAPAPARAHAPTVAELAAMLEKALDTIDACGSINMDEARALVALARQS